MKKYGLLAVILGMALCIPGCGFEKGTDAVVTVLEATPTPEPTPTPEVPEVTPTPEATPTPAPVIEQTPGGVNVEVKEGTYYTVADVNLRSDCNTEADAMGSVPPGTQLTSTGVCENGWIRVNYEGQTLYVSGDFVTTEAPAAGGEAEAPAE